MSGPLPIGQFRGRAGLIDFGWGHPRPDLLPVRQWAQASAAAIRGYGPAALGYGHPTGPGPLLDWLAARLAVPPGEVFVTAGASHALDLLCALLVTRADTVLVDSPTYHLALRILADHAGSLRAAPVRRPDALPALVGRLRAAGQTVPLLYLVPTFNNPTGASLAGRVALVEAAAGSGITIVEDDTYRELSYAGAPPPALYDLAADGAATRTAPGGALVLRIGSFAKTVAPGLRLGFLTAPPAVVSRLAERGYIHSGGGVNHATAMAMAAFGGSGEYDRHLARIRVAYRTARDTLLTAVRRHLPQVSVSTPAGGWFLWLRLPDGVDADELLRHAEAHGVSYLPGSLFCRPPGDGAGHLRLSFAMLQPPLLVEGVARLAAALAEHGAATDRPG